MFRNDDIARLVLRLGFGFSLLLHGIHKLVYGIAPVQAMLHAHGLPGWFGYGVFIGEVIAPIMIIFAFYARGAALIVIFNMLTAIALTTGFSPMELTQTGALPFELPLLYLLAAAVLFLSGPGKYGVNRL
jgi:putative oxidoreductase